MLMLPTVRALRKRFPRARLSILQTPLSAGAYMAGVDVDEVIVYDVLRSHRGLGGLVRLIMGLRRRKFDLAIDYEQHIKLVTLIPYLGGVPERVGFVGGDGRRGLLLTRPVLLEGRTHMACSFAELVRAVGAPCEVTRLAEVHVPQEDQAFVGRWLRRKAIAAGDAVVAIHPGSGRSAPGRRWPAERFASLADMIMRRYGAHVVLTGTQDEEELIRAVADTMVERPVIAAGELTFRQLAALLKRCSLAISNDTSLVHLAAAMGTPVVALFGPESPLRYRPIGEGHSVLYKEMECSPCINIHLGETKTCDTPVCMASISVEEVWQAVRERLDAACGLPRPEQASASHAEGGHEFKEKAGGGRAS